MRRGLPISDHNSRYMGAAIARFAAKKCFEVVAERVEVETGEGSDALERRPVPSAAMAAARHLKIAVAVAKLDRLSSDAAFTSA